MVESTADLDRNAAGLRAAMVAELVAGCALRSDRWRRAFQAVPRHVFVPQFLLDREHDGHYVTIDGRDSDRWPEWLRLVYSDEPLVTKLDGNAWVSSSSQPSLMALMLEALEISGSERVLEIGTGTGYNAALLCEGLDDGGQVVSVDIDGGLVQAARERLDDLGYRPTLATADGAAGHPNGAPFDRIIATCSLPLVPVEWITQTAEGGLILLNVYRDLGGGALALLRVENGRASGHFLPFSGGFMPTRTLHRVTGSDLLATHRAHDEGTGCDGVEHATTIMGDVLADPTFGMVAGLRLDAQRLGLIPEGEPEQTWLLGRDGSWAYQTTGLSGSLITVQSGRVKLWEELETAYDEWTALGRPGREEYGLTITAAGDHLMWHGDPSGPTWRL